MAPARSAAARSRGPQGTEATPERPRRSQAPWRLLGRLRAAPPALRLSSASLVLVNLVPLIGALALGWDVLAVLALFWAENAVIGVFNILRLTAARPAAGKGAEKLFLIPFFALHYGLFTFVHGLFVFSLFGDRAAGAPLALDLALFEGPLRLPLVCLAASHALSFAVNFLGRGAYKTTPPKRLMVQPYARVLVLHATILLGGALLEFTGAPAPGLALLVLLKIGVDLAAHLREHGPRHEAGGDASGAR